MSDSNLRLLVQPTYKDADQTKLADGLRELLADAEAGRLHGVTLVLAQADGNLAYRVLGRTTLMDALGHMQIVASHIIRTVLK